MTAALEVVTGPKRWATIHRRIALVGVGIDDVTMEETLEIIRGFIRTGGYHQIATANVDFLDKSVRDPELNTILRNCDLTVADGMPLIWASRLLGCKLAERVTGADLVMRMFRMSEQEGYRIFLLGATPERSQAALQSVSLNFPKAVVCGRIAPAFAPIAEMDNASILDTIHAAAPDILLVAFGNPKQEKWLAMHRDVLKVPVCIGVGASLDFLSGMQSRAPQWMQHMGLEWLYRLRSEPRRLAKRYWGNVLMIARHLSWQLFTDYLQERSPSKFVSVTRTEGSAVIKVNGGLNSVTVKQIEEQLNLDDVARDITLDLSDCTYVSANGTGWMLEVSQRLMAHGKRLELASVRKPVYAALSATFPRGLPFSIAHFPGERHTVAPKEESRAMS